MRKRNLTLGVGKTNLKSAGQAIRKGRRGTLGQGVTPPSTAKLFLVGLNASLQEFSTNIDWGAGSQELVPWRSGDSGEQNHK